MGIAGDGGLRSWTRRVERNRASDLIDRLGLGGLESRHIRDLSGGQAQRVFIARALIREPRLLVLDEPTASVDVATRVQILDMLDELNRAGMTVVLTTHDLNSVAARLPRIACLNRRVIAEGTRDEVLTEEILTETFGVSMAVLAHDGARIVTAMPDGADHPHHIHIHHDHRKQNESDAARPGRDAQSTNLGSLNDGAGEITVDNEPR